MKKLFTLRNQCSELTTLDKHLREIEESWLLPPKIVLTINLILDELITNIIEHSMQEREAEIKVEIRKDNDTVFLKVTDNGPPFDPTKSSLPDTTLPLANRRCGGLGIFLVKKYSDSFDYERIDNTNVFTIVKNLSQEGR